MTRTLRIGTRGSALALVQARWVAARLADTGIETELVVIRTEGDDRPVDTAWGEGAFVAAIAAALADGRVDLAVHSAKDVPTDEDPRLVVAAYPGRADARDALVARVRGTTLSTLPAGARVGTDSPRRAAFLRAVRPDLRLHPLHGNVDTRLARLDAGGSDALVLAVAGLTRLGRADRIDEVLPPESVAPAPGQGALAVQVRADDGEAIAAVAALDHRPTRIAVEAERALLAGTGGGCRSPIGAFGRVEGESITLIAGAARELPVETGGGGRVARVAWVRGSVPVGQAAELAGRLAGRLVELRGRPRVLVTRPEGRSAAFLARLDGLGIEAVAVPTIEIRPAGPGGDLDRALAGVRPGSWVVVTSASGAGPTLEALDRVGVAATGLRWAAVGDATASALAAGGIREPFRPSVATGAGLALELPVAAGEHVLLPRADLADGTLPAGLRARGALVDEVVAYVTVIGPASARVPLAGALDDGLPDALVLTSGSTARGLLALVPPDRQDAILGTPVVAIGSPTAGSAMDLGFRDVVTSSGPNDEALARTVADLLGLATGEDRSAAGAEPIPDADRLGQGPMAPVPTASATVSQASTPPDPATGPASTCAGGAR